jgi:hypothetical protein
MKTKLTIFASMLLMASGAMAESSANTAIDCGGSVQISATPKTGYHFLKWQEDGNTENPRIINNITAGGTYTAVFELNTYYIDPADIGDGVVIDGYDKNTPIPYGTKITLSATASDNCYEFEKWSDGNTDNPREYLFEGEVPFIVVYKLKTFTVNVQSANASEGDVEITVNK